MTKIYFHSANEDVVEVHGSERAHFGAFCFGLTMAILGNYTDEDGGWKSILRNLFPKEHRLHRTDNFARDIKLVFRTGTENVELNGKEIELFPLQLNTALSMGSDYVKLAARLHGQCEVHAYVEGKNRAYLAEIIKRGRQSGFYRDGQGWEDVIALLKKDNTSPIVTSYSVCNWFPNGSVANFEYPIIDGEEDWDAWNVLPYYEQWELGVTGLRESNQGLELRPDNWNEFYFNDSMNANKLITELLQSNQEQSI